MDKQYTSEKSIRIMEISRELEKLISNANDNPVAQRIYQLSGDVAIIAAMDLKEHNELLNKYIKLQEKQILSTRIFMEYISRIGYSEDYQEFAQAFLNDGTDFLN